jgi:hypothetical protein
MILKLGQIGADNNALFSKDRRLDRNLFSYARSKAPADFSPIVHVPEDTAGKVIMMAVSETIQN